MNRLNKQIVAALLGVGSICGTLSDAQACGGRGGSGGGYRPHRVAYARPAYPQQYPQQFAQYPPQPQQPWVGAPQTVHPQFAQQPTQQLPPVVRRNPQPVAGQFQGQFQNQVQVQGGAQRQTAMRPVSGQVNIGQAEGSALESLGGMPTQQVAQRQTAGVSQPQQFQGQQTQQLQQQGQQQFQGQQPVQQQQQQQQVQQQPEQVQQQQPQQQLQQQPQQQQAEQQDPMSEAQQSALDALAGMGEEEASQATFTEQSQPATTQTHLGQWRATLGNGSTIELSLQADGSFTWIANTNGKASSFEGHYLFENGSLTLVRSSDNQKLAGSLTPTANGGVNFKLNGAKDNGVNFSRG